MTWIIRRAEGTDADAIATLLRGLHYFHRFEWQTDEETRVHVRAHLAMCLADGSHSVYVAETASDGVIGYAAVHWLPYLFLAGPEGYISELFVAPAARGQGVGKELLGVVKEEARARGCARLSLLNIRDRESYERAFYAKDGWEERSDAANFVYSLT